MPDNWIEPYVVIPMLGDNNIFISMIEENYPEIAVIRSASYSSNYQMIELLMGGTPCLITCKTGENIPPTRLNLAITTCLGGESNERYPPDFYQWHQMTPTNLVGIGVSLFIRTNDDWEETPETFGVEAFNNDESLLREIDFLNKLNSSKKRG